MIQFVVWWWFRFVLEGFGWPQNQSHNKQHELAAAQWKQIFSSLHLTVHPEGIANVLPGWWLRYTEHTLSMMALQCLELNVEWLWSECQHHSGLGRYLSIQKRTRRKEQQRKVIRRKYKPLMWCFNLAKIASFSSFPVLTLKSIVTSLENRACFLYPAVQRRIHTVNGDCELTLFQRSTSKIEVSLCWLLWLSWLEEEDFEKNWKFFEKEKEKKEKEKKEKEKEIDEERKRGGEERGREEEREREKEREREEERERE